MAYLLLVLSIMISADTSSRTFRGLMDRLDWPMVIVTTAAHGVRAGCLVGFHSPCSVEPARYAIWLSKANHTYRIGLLASIFAVHFLRAEAKSLARLFGAQTGDAIDKFAQTAWTSGPDGVPLLYACPDRFIGQRIAHLDTGADHVCIILAPILTAPTPQLDLQGSSDWLTSRQVNEIHAGHIATERQ